MPTAVNESDFLFEWDLQNIDLSQTKISSPKFSFQGSEFNLNLWKKEGAPIYSCTLKYVETLSKSGRIHFRFDLVKRLDNTIAKSCQYQRDLNQLKNGWGVPDWIDPAAIQDHILKVKMWTSEYDLEYDLENEVITRQIITPESFLIGDNKLRVLLKKNKGGDKYDCLLKYVDSAISSKVRFQVDLYARLDNSLVKSDKREFTFNKTNVSQGFEDWFDVKTIRDHVLKVKVWIFNPFSDFVEKPIEFESIGFQLSNKTCSNLSFLVGDAFVYVLHGILTSRSDYFRAMLEGFFKEARVPMTVESKIPIHGIDVDVFKMIIEWIYTMDIKSLNDPFSPTLILDLEKVYVAADMYLLSDLCESIGKYLNHLLTAQNFGEIYQVAKRIGSESLEKDIIRAWMSKSDSFNENDDQINVLIRDFDAIQVEEGKETREEGGHVEVEVEGVDFERGGANKEDEDIDVEELDENAVNAAIVGISQKFIQVSSNWDGDSSSKLCVIKCLATLLEK
jgi:hypothetical protein